MTKQPSLSYNQFRTEIKGLGLNISDSWNEYKEHGNIHTIKSEISNKTSPKTKVQPPNEKKQNLSNMSSDTMILMAEKMDGPTIFNLCQTNKLFNEILCSNLGDNFWSKVYQNTFKDKPQIIPSVKDQLKSRLKKNPILINFLKKVGNYDLYTIELQNSFYEDAINEYFGEVANNNFNIDEVDPQEREEIPITQENLDLIEVKSSFAGILVMISYEWGNKEYSSGYDGSWLSYDEAVELVLTRPNNNNMWLLDWVMKVFNSIYGTNYDLQFGDY